MLDKKIATILSYSKKVTVFLFEKVKVNATLKYETTEKFNVLNTGFHVCVGKY